MRHGFIKRLILLLTVFTGMQFRLFATDEPKLISVYPVPFKGGILTVNINYPNSGVATLEVRNLIGRKIQEKKINPANDYVTFDDIDSNPNGVYVVVAKNASGKILEILKFIISK